MERRDRGVVNKNKCFVQKGENAAGPKAVTSRDCMDPQAFRARDRCELSSLPLSLSFFLLVNDAFYLFTKVPWS